MCRRGMRSREKRNNRVTRLRLTRSRSISILREELPLWRDNTISKCTKRRRPESGKETERARSRNSARVSAEHSPPSRPRLWRPSHPPFTVHPFSSPSSRTLATSRLNRARFRERLRAIDHGTEVRKWSRIGSGSARKDRRKINTHHHRHRHPVSHRCPTKLPLSLLEVTNGFVLMQHL